MSRKLVIFGLAEIAQLAHFYFSTDSSYKVAAFTVDQQYIRENKFCNLPVIPFDDIVKNCPPDQYDMFVAVGYTQVNAVRKQKYLQTKSLGYFLPSYVSSHATVLNEEKMGDNCFIFENSTIQPFVSIGNNVTVLSCTLIAHHSSIADHCFIGAHVVVSGGVDIGQSCFIGVNATLRDHIKVGEKCVIGAGATLLADAEPGGVYRGSASERSPTPSSMLKKI